MFSITDSSASDFVSWKVRTMPMRATLYDGVPATSRPSSCQVPSSGLSKPVRRLNSVVLPAPFGPISAVIAPRCTSMWSTSTATRPPNVRFTPSTTRIGSGLATPGSGATPSVHEVVRASEVTDRHLSPVADDPLWSVDHEEHDRYAHDDEAQRAHLVGVDEPPGQVAGVDRFAAQDVDELQRADEHDRADDGAEDARGAAEDEDRERGEREPGRVVVRVHRLLRQREHDAAHRAEDPAEHEALHLVPVRVLAEARHRVFVLADGLEDPAPRAAHQKPRRATAQRDDRPPHDDQPGAVLVVL